MKRFFASARPATVAIGSLIALFAIAGAAQAVTSTIFKYSTPRTGHFSIHSAAMTPSNYLAAAEFENQWQVGALFPIGAQFHCFNTGVNLPHGAIITGLVIYVAGDSASSNNIQPRLLRQQHSNGTTGVIAKGSFFNNAQSRHAVNIPIEAAMATVNNATHSYGFGICLRDAVFYSARIKYTYDNAGA